MNFNQFIKDLGIRESQQYTIKEIAFIVDRDPRTVETWCNPGLNVKGVGPLVLKRFWKGSRAVIPGRCLIEFLTIRNQGEE